ncbi:hypothetical protein BaRGS_00024642, partial [Batillaria attramentaria]
DHHSLFKPDHHFTETAESTDDQPMPVSTDSEYAELSVYGVTYDQLQQTSASTDDAPYSPIRLRFDTSVEDRSTGMSLNSTSTSHTV